MTDRAAVFDDLVAEQDQIDGILTSLDDTQWRSPSGADGWSVADVVLHLAQSEEAVIATAAGAADRHPAAGLARARQPEVSSPAGPAATKAGPSTDEVMASLVAAERAEPAVVFGRWRTARTAAVAALRAADPNERLPWVGAPLKPATLATTRLAEHWAHALDITGPLGVPYPDTMRLRHIAWLGHSTLPYAFALVGEEPHDVYCELTAPDDSTWCFGRDDADSAITGPAGAFCRVGARRLAPSDSGLDARGPHGSAALRALRNYAG